jgi:hypothetical protein
VQSHEEAVPEVRILNSFHKFKVANEDRLQLPAYVIFDAVMPAPQRPAFLLGRVREEAFPVSRGLIFLNSSAREPGMNPFRIRGID